MKGPTARVFSGAGSSLNLPVMLLYSPLFARLSKNPLAEKISHPGFRRLIKLGSWGLIPLPMGAPMAALTAEHLAVCGVTGLLQAGIAGSLTASLPVGSLVRTHRYWNQTGTAAMYGFPWDGFMDVPSSRMSDPLDELFSERDKSVWSADGVYCETDELIALRQASGIAAVEMEGAALAAVCSRYHLPFEALYCISDELFHNEWKPSFNSQAVNSGLDLLAEKLALLAIG